jgi:putative acetyltransferase
MITVAERGGALVGFVTVDPKTRYLDQIVVAPEAWGSDVAQALMAEARRLSPGGLDLAVNADNVGAMYKWHWLCKVEMTPRGRS